MSVGKWEMLARKRKMPSDISYLSFCKWEMSNNISRLSVGKLYLSSDIPHLPGDISHLSDDISHLSSGTSHLQNDISYLPDDKGYLPT